MKVKIGKYPAHFYCKVYDRWIMRKYGVDSYMMASKDFTKVDKFIEKLDDAIQTIYSWTINPIIRLVHKKQRIKVVIHDYDVWSMDTTLAHIIVPMLKLLKEKKQGAPMIDIKDVPKELRPTPEDIEKFKEDGTTDPKFFDRWEWVMDEMIFAFESRLEDSWESKFYSGEHDMYTVPVDKNGNEVPEDEAKLFELRKGPNDTFKVDRKGLKAYQKRIDNGFKLFGKYYLSLWD